MNIHLCIQAQQAIDDGTSYQLFPVAACWLAQHQLGYLPFVSDLHQLARDIGAAGADHFGTQVFGEQGMFLQAALCLFPISFSLPSIFEPADKFAGEGQVALRLDADSDKICAQAMRESPGIPYDLACMGPRIEAHHDALAGHAVLTDAMLGHVLLELRFGLLGDAAQRQFAQRCQVAFAKKVVQRSLDAFRRIDVAMLHALAQSMRRNVDQLHFFSLVENPIGQGFAYTYTRDARHQVIETFQVLDVQCRDNINARFENLLHVLIAFRVPGAGYVSMRQFIDQHHSGMAGDDSVCVHLFERHPPVAHLLAWNDLQITDLRLRLRAFVRLHIADYYIGAAALAAVSFVEHGVGLASAGCRAEIDAQASAPPDVGYGSLRRCTWLLFAGRLNVRRRWRGQVAVAQPISARQFLRVGASLLARAFFVVGHLLFHDLIIS